LRWAYLMGQGKNGPTGFFETEARCSYLGVESDYSSSAHMVSCVAPEEMLESFAKTPCFQTNRRR